MAVATPTPKRATAGARKPTIPKLVRVAKMPAAGVKAPYAQPWKAAPRNLKGCQLSFASSEVCGNSPGITPDGTKPRHSTRITIMVNVTHHTVIRTSVSGFVSAKSALFHSVANLAYEAAQSTSQSHLRGVRQSPRLDSSG